MTMPATESERVRGYLVAQANKLSIPELVEKVQSDCAPLGEVGGTVPATKFNDRPAKGEWSAAEVWTHILQMSEHGVASITGILDSGKLPARATDTISGETRAGLTSSNDYWETYKAIREPFYERVLKTTGTEHLDVAMNHPMFGNFSWREWLLFMRVHDLDHMRQLRAIAAAFAS